MLRQQKSRSEKTLHEVFIFHPNCPKYNPIRSYNDEICRNHSKYEYYESLDNNII